MLKHRDFVGMLVTMHQSGTHWVKHILTSAIYHEEGFEQPKSIYDEDRFIGNPKSHRGRPGVPSITASHSIPNGDFSEVRHLGQGYPCLPGIKLRKMGAFL